MNKKTLDISTPKDTKEEVANEEFMRYSQHTKSFETVTNTLETHSSQRTILNKQERKQQISNMKEYQVVMAIEKV